MLRKNHPHKDQVQRLIPITGVYRGTTFSINGEAFSINGEVFSVDFFTQPLTGYDVVLGTLWLASLGPILWDFGALTMSFWRSDHQVC
jgi:hypothetical protein